MKKKSKFGRNPFRRLVIGSDAGSAERADVIAAIERTFGSKRSKKISALEEEKDKEELERKHSSSVILGASAITRSIERKDPLRMIVLLEDARNRDASLVDHIPTMASAIDVPVYSFRKANHVLARVFGVKRLSAFAVRSADGEDSVVDDACSKIASSLPSIRVPLRDALRRRAEKRKRARRDDEEAG